MFLLILVSLLWTMWKTVNFTFHNVSINTKNSRWCIVYHQTLHSTMFLLIRRRKPIPPYAQHTLHSTMFLLIQYSPLPICGCEYIFTFHNVSINTNCEHDAIGNKAALHSTMFLLIRTLNPRCRNSLTALHSTMFLLIPFSQFRNKRSSWLYIPQCFY